MLDALSAHSGESTGSAAYRIKAAENPPVCTEETKVNFRGYDYDYYNKPEKKTSPLVVIGSIAAFAAAAIGGLGIAHKNNVLSKINDGKFKNVLKKCEPAAQTCHKWCAAVKKFGINTRDKIAGVFKGK